MRPRLSRSLSAHLRMTEDHSRLPFHPSCPVCRRDRLAGSLDGEELVSRRTQAAVAAGLIAFSTGGGSAAAVASPPDEVSEGTAEVVVGGDHSSDPVFDPGLETTQLPDEASQAPAAVVPTTDTENIAMVEQEPATDTLEPVVDVDLDEAADSSPAPAPATSEPAPSPPPEPSPPAAVPAEGAPQEPQEKAVGGHRREARVDHAAKDEAAAEPAPAEPMPVSAPTTAPAGAPAERQAGTVVEPADPAQPEPTTAVHAAATADPGTTTGVEPSAATRAVPGDRFHTVRRGESLWSIAADLLGEGATVASIAREVNRLWELNEERIATGRPDLLFAGTRLRLR